MNVDIKVAARLLLTLGCLLLSSVAFAGNEFYKEPAPAWANPVELPEIAGLPEDKIQNGVYYLLIDNQVMASQNREPHYYQHHADYIVNQTGVESNSQINIGFSPEYQRLALHTLRIIRDGKPIDKINSARMSVIQREEEMDDLIYNGRMTLNIILDDVRVGDTIEYSFSRQGMNPVFQNVFSYSHYLNWTVPVGRLSLRVLWNKPIPLQYKIDNSDLKVVHTKTTKGNEYLIQGDHIEPVKGEDDTPSWFDPWGMVKFSELKSWSEVALWSERLFRDVVVEDNNINSLVADIQSKHTDKEAQISAALRFVQDEIRYLGIELGQNSHKPKLAFETLRDRYGDCKDKTVLFITLLKGLGIDAYPALVNTENNLDQVIPSIQAFDHVITHFEFNHKRYWLDPTRSYQHGNIDSIHQPDYKQALVLRAGTSTLTPMDIKQSKHGIVVKDRFVLHTEGDVEFSSESAYFGWNAERQRAHIADKGRDQIQQDYLEFFQRYYPGTSFAEPIKFSDDTGQNTIITTENYRIANFWKDQPDSQRYLADFHANIVGSSISIPDEPTRLYPLYLKHPEHVEQVIELNFDSDKWNFDDVFFVEDNDFFVFTNDVKFEKEKRRLTLNFSYQSKVDNVPADKYQDYVAALKRAYDYKDYSIFRKYPVQPSVTEPEPWYTGYINPVNVIILFIALYLLVFVLWRVERWRHPEVTDAIFFPVSMPKLIAMWILTFGLYGMYWFYRNFRYIKKQESNAIMPIARGIFSHFWYYPLWSKLKQDNDARFESSHLPGKPAAILLATVFFIAGVAGNVKEIAMPAVFLGLLMILPLANYILFVNGRDAPALVHNSRWNFRHYLLLLVSVPLLALSAGSDIGVLPSNAVVKGSRLLDYDIKLMQRRGILKPDDVIDYFYSDAFLSVGDDGNGFTQRHVFSYWKDENKKFLVEQAAYVDIKDIKADWNRKFGENTTVTIVRDDGSEFILYVSNTDHKDKLFVENLKKRWQSNRQ